MIKILCVELFKATCTRSRSQYASKKKFETALTSMLYQKHLRNLEGRDLCSLVNVENY